MIRPFGFAENACAAAVVNSGLGIGTRQRLRLPRQRPQVIAFAGPLRASLVLQQPGMKIPELRILCRCADAGHFYQSEIKRRPALEQQPVKFSFRIHVVKIFLEPLISTGLMPLIIKHKNSLPDVKFANRKVTSPRRRTGPKIFPGVWRRTFPRAARHRPPAPATNRTAWHSGNNPSRACKDRRGLQKFPPPGASAPTIRADRKSTRL